VSVRRPSRRSDLRKSWSETVRRGWNRASYNYRPRGRTDDCFGHLETEYRDWLEPLRNAVPRGSRVLDLGCGTGVPAARILARRFRVTGVDISDVQVRRARRLVPRARFLRADLSEVDFPPGSFSAVVSLYAIIHVPREKHRPLFRKVARWLAPGGWFVAILGRSGYEGKESRWLGSDAPMLWSHYDAATYRRWFRAEGFRIVREAFVPEDGGGHELFVARKRRGTPTGPRGASTGRDGSGRPSPVPLRPSRARRPRGGRGPLPSRSR